MNIFKLKNKNLRQENFNSFKKIMLPIIIFLSFIFTIIKYFVNYYKYSNLNFSEEDKFLFTFAIIITFIFSVLFVYILFDRNRLIKIVENLKRELEATEDNWIWTNRDTQEMISNYFDEENEKK